MAPCPKQSANVQNITFCWILHIVTQLVSMPVNHAPSNDMMVEFIKGGIYFSPKIKTLKILLQEFQKSLNQ